MIAVSFGCVWVCLSVVFIVSCALYLLILGSCYTVYKRIVNIMSVHIKEQHTGGINTIPLKLATLLTFETLKWK